MSERRFGVGGGSAASVERLDDASARPTINGGRGPGVYRGDSRGVPAARSVPDTRKMRKIGGKTGDGWVGAQRNRLCTRMKRFRESR